MASVAYLHIAPEPGAPVRAVAEVEAVVGQGLLGDRNYGLGDGREITIVSLEELAQAEQEWGAPIPPGSTRRNVTISAGLLPREPGARIMIGDVAVAVTQDCTPCRQMETWVGPGAKAVLTQRAGICGRIVSGGTLRVGDAVVIES